MGLEGGEEGEGKWGCGGGRGEGDVGEVLV